MMPRPVSAECPGRASGPDVSGERHRKGAGTKEGIVKYMILQYGS